MKIAFIISTLRGGGAERVAVTLANELTKRGHSLQFVVHSDSESAYEVDPKINIHSLFTTREGQNDTFSKLRRRFGYYFRLNKILNSIQPDVVVTFIRGTNGKVLPLTYLKNIPHVATEHDTYKIGFNEIWTQIERRYLYRLASIVTVLTERDWNEYYSKFLNNVEVVPNPLPFKIQADERMDNREKFILTAGDLDRWQWKGFDKLIIAFSKLHNNFSEWRIKIAGTGRKGEKKLREIAKNNNVIHKVDFLGFVHDMPELYRKASVFALYSKNEPFGMVLTEAMSQGCPCISYDSGFGPSEIIDNGVDGVLIQEDSIEVFTEKLGSLMENSGYREKIAKSAKKKVERYSIDNITDRWERLLNCLVDE